MPYVLIVVPDPKLPSWFYVYDPQENGKLVFESDSYEELRYWMFEDEYILAEGRIKPY